MAQTVKRLPTMRGTWVRSMGREDPLEKEMATHSSTLAWEIPWMEEPGRLQSMDTTEVTQQQQQQNSNITYVCVCLCVYVCVLSC